MMSRTPYSLYLDPTQLERLRALSRDSGVPCSALIRRALARYLDDAARALDALRRDPALPDRISPLEKIALASLLGGALLGSEP